MKILSVAQNEYALVNKESPYGGLLTSGLKDCIAIAAYSPGTQKSLLIHLDRNSSVTEAMTLLTTLLKEDVDLRVFVVRRMTDDHSHKNPTLTAIKQALAREGISFTKVSTKTGTVVLLSDGAVRHDLQHLQNRSGTEHALAIYHAGRLTMLEHEIAFSPAFNVQWHITNLNALLNENKPLHPLVFQSGLNTEAELMDMRLILILEEVNKKFPYVDARQRVEVKNIIFDIFWARFGKAECDRLIEANKVALEEAIAELEPGAPEILLYKKEFDTHIPIFCEQIRLQYEDFAENALQFLPQVKALKARHFPLVTDEPTIDFDFYIPLEFKIPH
jgi:hypothetical protein